MRGRRTTVELILSAGTVLDAVTAEFVWLADLAVRAKEVVVFAHRGATWIPDTAEVSLGTRAVDGKGKHREHEPSRGQRVRIVMLCSWKASGL